ncbi:MAG: nucleotidyltransferase family protein [Clostridia bacterium]|nr:nucleotidyltransferase family protein [Clostridia bacterium]
MRIAGIAAEYNPFHNGHKYHIEETRRLARADRIAVVMSGSFVQRGEPACADKFTRAEWAVTNGADIVIELPDVFALSCAERFAKGAVRILAGAGLADVLSFGSETGSMEKLKLAADSIPDHETLAEALNEGKSYPRAVAETSGSDLSPNDILAVEYIRAAEKYCPDTELLAVKREGGGYLSSELASEYSSAMAIRSALSRYGAETRMSPAVFDELNKALPRNVLDGVSALMREGRFPATAAGLSDAVLAKLRTMSREEIMDVPEVGEGLENLFLRESMNASDADEMLRAVKSKRYTMARLKRIAMNALLGVTKELQDAAAEDGSALYARVLAVRKGSEDLLERLANGSRIPVIIKASDREDLPPLAKMIERISSRAHSIRAVGQPYDKSACDDSSFRLIVR